MTSPYVFHLGAAPTDPAGAEALSIGAFAKRFPLLSGISACALTLPPGAVLGPLWHINAGLLACCTEGTASATILSPGNVRDCFTLEADELFFVEQGFAYSIANFAARPARLVGFSSHEQPIACAPAALIRALPSLVGGSATAPPRTASPHKLALREIAPVIGCGGAITRTATGEELSILDRLALGTLDLLPSGTVEPHWHPNCGELGYVLGGRALLSIVRPEGGIDRVEICPGDLYFVPAAYPHWQETLGEAALRIVAGFDHQEPLTIGLGNVAVAFRTAQ